MNLSAEPIRLLLFLLVILAFVGLNVAYLVWVERKGAGRFQRRPGPTEVGPAGLLQPIADAIKIMTKQLLVPAGVDGLLFRGAPVLVMVPALAGLARGAGEGCNCRGIRLMNDLHPMSQRPNYRRRTGWGRTYRRASRCATLCRSPDSGTGIPALFRVRALP